MRHIEVEILNPDVIEDTELMMVCAARMTQRGQELYLNQQRGLALVKLRDSPISSAKADTALYRLTAGTQFSEMALGNNFAYEDRGTIRSMPLKEFSPLVAIGDITLYLHKSKRLLYVSRHRTGSPPLFGTNDTETMRFLRIYGPTIENAIMEDWIVYETYEAQTLLTNYTV